MKEDFCQTNFAVLFFYKNHCLIEISFLLHSLLPDVSAVNLR